VDAEQTYYQPAIRSLTVHHLMKNFNKKQPIFYDTVQSYLKVCAHVRESKQYRKLGTFMVLASTNYHMTVKMRCESYLIAARVYE